MVDDGHAVAAPLADLAPLHARFRVVERVLVGALRERHALDADAEPRMVHHREHVLEAAVLLADQVADRALAVAIGEHAGRTRVDAELVLDRHAPDVVALAAAAVGVDQKLGHDEQRNALHAFRRVGRAREHEVDDVVRHVVLAPRDENLGAVDAVVVAFGHRARAHRGEIRAGLRLGEIHGPASTRRT